MAKAKNNDTGANLGFEAKLWAAADALLSKLLSGEILVQNVRLKSEERLYG